MNKRLLVLIPLFLLLSVLFMLFPRVAQAANLPQPFIDEIQQMLKTALAPFQSAQQALITRVSNVEATVTPLPSEIAGIQATLTPIPGQIANLQATQASQALQINGLQNPVEKNLKVFDANGQEIGILIYHNGTNNTVYSTPLKRFIYLNDPGFGNRNGFANRTAALYQSSDCTGTPYNPETGAGYDAIANDLLPFNPQVYYIFNNSETSTTITSHSQGGWNYSTNHLDCSPDVRTNIQAYQLFPVDLPFSLPLAMPLQFKYQ